MLVIGARPARASRPEGVAGLGPAETRLKLVTAPASPTCRLALIVAYPARMHSRPTWALLAALAGTGCGSTQPRVQAPPTRSEIVVDEATVVTVAAPGARVDGSLPPLPQAWATTSPAFRQGLGLAETVLNAPGPTPPPDDSQPTYDAWLGAELEPWLEARGKAVQDALKPLSELAPSSPSEQVIAAALVGMLYARTHEQLLAVPPPPVVRADEKLLHIYRDQVNQTATSWLDSAVTALRQCANGAAAQAEPAFGPWLDRCQQELARQQQRAEAAKALSLTVQTEREAENLEATPPP